MFLTQKLNAYLLNKVPTDKVIATQGAMP